MNRRIFAVLLLIAAIIVAWEVYATVKTDEDKKLYPETVSQTYFDDSKEANNTVALLIKTRKPLTEEQIQILRDSGVRKLSASELKMVYHSLIEEDRMNEVKSLDFVEDVYPYKTKTTDQHSPEQQNSKLMPTHLRTAPKPAYTIEFDLNSARGFEVSDGGTPKLTLKRGSRGEIDVVISHAPYIQNKILLLLTCYGVPPYDYWILAGSGGRNLTLPKGVTYKFSNQLIELDPNERVRVTLTLHADSDAIPGSYKISIASYVLVSYNRSAGHRGMNFLLQIK